MSIRLKSCFWPADECRSEFGPQTPEKWLSSPGSRYLTYAISCWVGIACSIRYLSLFVENSSVWLWEDVGHRTRDSELKVAKCIELLPLFNRKKISGWCWQILKVIVSLSEMKKWHQAITNSGVLVCVCVSAISSPVVLVWPGLRSSSSSSSSSGSNSSGAIKKRCVVRIRVWLLMVLGLQE